jgi:proline racemase
VRARHYWAGDRVISGRVVGQVQVEPHDAVVPEIGGTAFITGRHEFIIDPRDELGRGFLI